MSVSSAAKTGGPASSSGSLPAFAGLASCAAAPQIEVSVVVPVHNEAGNVRPLLSEIRAALAHGPAYEVIYVDDGSRDATAAELAAAGDDYPELRVLRHTATCGQSAAIRTGVFAARGRFIVTLDGDGQNDPADIPRLLAQLNSGNDDAPTGLVTGQRLRRRDNLVRRLSSRLANAIRGRLLSDGATDTGCGLKTFPREVFLRLPYFDHMHRFMPALMRREGYAVRFHPVNHRPRRRGRSKYGINNRLWAGVVDMLGVMWLQRRRRRPPEIAGRP